MANVISDKSFAFAVRIVKLAKFLREKKEYELSSQILKSGTSIGANVQEAQRPQSDKDFLSKMHIASKEASETQYWLKLLHAADIISHESFIDIHKDIDEIIRILVSIVKTKENKIKNRLRLDKGGF